MRVDLAGGSSWQAACAHRGEQVNEQGTRALARLTCRQQLPGLVIEALGRVVGGGVAGVEVDEVRVEIEHLQPRPVERERLDVEGGRASHEIEIVRVIGWDLDDLVLLPKWAQTCHQRQAVAAIVFKAEPAIE